MRPPDRDKYLNARVGAVASVAADECFAEFVQCARTSADSEQ
jgi:hypothetical protein